MRIRNWQNLRIVQWGCYGWEAAQYGDGVLACISVSYPVAAAFLSVGFADCSNQCYTSKIRITVSWGQLSEAFRDGFAAQIYRSVVIDRKNTPP